MTHNMTYLGISCKPISNKPLIIPRGSVQRYIERFIEKLKLCNIVTNMENRVILRPCKPGDKNYKMLSSSFLDLLREVCGKLVVDEDFAVERLSLKYFDEMNKFRLVCWEGCLVMYFIGGNNKSTLGTGVSIQEQ